MSHFEDETCDKCGATIVLERGTRRPSPFQFIVSTNPDDEDRFVYEEHTRILCTKCELKLLWWIDEDDESGECDVDLPPQIKSGRHIRQIASELNQLADDLEGGFDDMNTEDNQ